MVREGAESFFPCPFTVVLSSACCFDVQSVHQLWHLRFKSAGELLADLEETSSFDDSCSVGFPSHFDLCEGGEPILNVRYCVDPSTLSEAVCFL